LNGNQYFVYILTNHRNTAHYTGVTGDLKRRIYEHKNKLVDGFTKKYAVTKLVYYEVSEDKEAAVSREKQIKGLLKSKKEDLIVGMNPEWRDLYDEL
jgi:putative endonuclease